MGSMKELKSKILEFRESLTSRDIALFVSVLLLSGIATFAVVSSDSKVSGNPEQKFNQELNSSHNSAVLEFFNESMEISMEQGSETTFYIDLDGRGNADMRLENLTRDGKIRSSSEIFDYRSGVYILHFSYHIGENGEEHWLKPEKMEKIG